MFQTLHAISQDGLSLEFVAATADKEWNIQDARGGVYTFSCHNTDTAFIYIGE